MIPSERVEALIADLKDLLDHAALLTKRGREAFDSDVALPLAFEAMCNRVGDIAKKLMLEDPQRFSDAAWKDAAKNRDFVVHQYHRIDPDILWLTAVKSFPHLRELLSD